MASGQIGNQLFRLLRSPTLGIAVVLMGGGLVLYGFAFGYINDVEDFYSTALGTSLFVNAALSGHNPFWTDLLGLGIPQPFRISLIQHPLAFLFAFYEPIIAVKIIVVVQGLVGAVFFYLLCRRLQMPVWIAVTCSVSFISCSSVVEFLFIDDFFSSFLSFCFYPIVLYLVVILGDFQSRQAALATGVAVGLVTGLMVATGHASHILSYLLVLGVFLVFSPHLMREKWKILFVAAIVCSLVSLGVICLLASEFHRFPPDVTRFVHPNSSIDLNELSAFGLAYWEGIGTSWGQFEALALRDGLRVIAFGPVAAACAAIALFLPLGHQGTRIKAALVAALLFMFSSPSPLSSIVSATWVFRDGVNVFGLLLFGLLLAQVSTGPAAVSRSVVGTVCVAQVLLSMLFLFPRWHRAIENDLAREAVTASQASLRGGGAVFREIRKLVGLTASRILMTEELANEVRRGRLLSGGVVVNGGALHGLAIVNAFPRGIATGGLYPDLSLMEGTINATGANAKDKAFLDTLGIGHVLAFNNETVAAGLERIGDIRASAAIGITVWRNPDAWPKVVELDQDALRLTPSIDPECGHERFLCSRFEPLRRLLRDRPATEIVQEGGRISMVLKPADRDRVLLINSWYRPEWNAANSKAAVVPLFGQLLGVLVPRQTTHVTVAYRPAGVMFGYAISALTVLFASAIIVVLVVRTKWKKYVPDEAGRGKQGRSPVTVRWRDLARGAVRHAASETGSKSHP